jgi:UDP-2,3-diacylglucosamine pyrophosphatase LpxH
MCIWLRGQGTFRLRRMTNIPVFPKKYRLRNGGELVLLGDIIDMWRRDFVKAIMESEPVISKLIEMKSKVSIHYLEGNHDFHMLRMGNILGEKFPFRVRSEVDGIAMSGARSLYLGMDKDETLVFGHTHEPFEKVESGVISSGSWKKSPCPDYTYLEISEGEMTKKKF